MTIKELCINNHCCKCPFFNICKYYKRDIVPSDFIADIDTAVTRAIINTAEILKREEDLRI